MNTVCFVHTLEDQPSRRWFMYPAKHLKAETCSVVDLQRGREPEADTYFVERELWHVDISRLHSRGKRVILWLDDAYWLMPDLISPLNDFWKGVWPTFSRDLGDVDAVVCPSAQLARDMEQYTSSTFYVPNYHDYPEIPPRPSHSCLVVGWAGSYQHLHSWRDTEAWKVIPKDAFVEIVDHRAVYQLVHSKGFRTIFHPRLDEYEYLRMVLNWDAYIIPVHGHYDRRKSWVKALDACYCGTPWFGVGDAVWDVYGELPGQVSVLIGNKGYPGLQEWAEKQRVTYHLDEWKGLLL